MNIWTLRVHTFDHALFGHWNNQTYESWTGIANNAHKKSDSIKKTHDQSVGHFGDWQ
jgi:hypothetical protein